MCGIAGAIWTADAPPVDQHVLERMTDMLAHRGPDGRGFYTSHVARPTSSRGVHVGLGHRRLSIIDMASGQQPLSNEDGSVWVTFNGEIYNFLALRQRLEAAGHAFRTHSDTEVLVHLYEDEGPEFLGHLNGMFALAIWDARRGSLLLARDRLGKKPLVYRAEPERLLFASELKSLLAVPGVPRELNPHALDGYLAYQYVPHPHTIYRGIHKLPPGHFGIWRDGELKVERYWRPQFAVEKPRPAAEYRQELAELLTSAVELRLQSDVPLGAFLSGGVDSSIVVALMKQLGHEPVKTFSIGFPVAAYDETSFARQVAAHLGTEHHEFRVEPDAVGVLNQLAWIYDEPFADASAIPTWYVSKLTREHVTVALTGDGGDELFAGYNRYDAVALSDTFDRIPPLRAVATNRLWQRLPADGRQRSLSRRLRRFTAGLARSSADRFIDWVGIFPEPLRAELYTDEFLAQLPDDDPGDFIRDTWHSLAGRDAVTAASLTDLVTYLPCDLMTKVDMASMAHGLECRQPILDYRVVELAAAMPVALKYRFFRRKRILRETFGHLLPPEVLKRPKMGFGVPLDHWFRHELRELAADFLLGATAADRGYFRPETVRKLWDEHQAGLAEHSHRLWALVMFEAWHRCWLDTAAEPAHLARTSV